jgi:hypothetical protein
MNVCEIFLWQPLKKPFPPCHSRVGGNLSFSVSHRKDILFVAGWSPPDPRLRGDDNKRGLPENNLAHKMNPYYHKLLTGKPFLYTIVA